jgi:hypothetical protein
LEQLPVLPGRLIEFIIAVHRRLPTDRTVAPRMITGHHTFLRTRQLHQRSVVLEFTLRQQELTRDMKKVIGKILQNGIDGDRKIQDPDTGMQDRIDPDQRIRKMRKRIGHPDNRIHPLPLLGKR